MLLDVLRADEELAGWLMELENADAPRVPVALPDRDDLPEVLLDLAVPHEDINELVTLGARLAADPEAMELLERCVRAYVRDMGEIGKRIELPSFPASLGPLGRCFHIYVFVAALPYVRAHHERLGISAEVSRRTLADLGRHLAVHRRRTGTYGLLTPWWISLHFHGELYQLGRLQFQRARLGERMARAVKAAGREAGPDDLCLSLHITDFRGPLTAAACDRSIAFAREFFGRHFADERYELVICQSWLLDPQLKSRLPGGSNIVRFQERFRVAVDESEPTDAPVGFVFGDPTLAPDALPRRTSVERAVGDHLRAGGRWYTGHGWFVL